MQRESAKIPTKNHTQGKDINKEELMEQFLNGDYDTKTFDNCMHHHQSLNNS